MCYIEIYVLLALSLTVSGEFRHLPEDCGKTRLDNKTTRIINGDDADLGQFPFSVRIGFRKNRYAITFFCGGSLVNRYFVITAAHCEKIGTIVRVGETNLLTDTDCNKEGVCAPPHEDIPIRNIMISPIYCMVTATNDISLVELQRPVKFNDFIQPVCLPWKSFEHREFYGEDVIIMGWGLINSNPVQFARTLKYISAPIIHPQNCDDIYDEDMVGSQWCIGYPYGRDSCNGDSGGPVVKSMKHDGKRRWYLFGAVSYGKPICGYGPAVYTDVSKFLKWIVKKINKG